MSTYEELMAKSRELYAAGDVDGAKRLAQIAVSRKGQDQTAEDIKPNPDGTYGQPPEGFIRDPNTGAMTSQELQANRMQPNALQSARVGSEEGALWGGRDEATGGIAAITPGLPGTAGERYDMAQLRARAELEAARRDNPIATTAGEIAGSVVTGGTVAQGLGALGTRLAPRAAQTAGNLARRNFATRALTGGAATAPGAALYGFNAGEGDKRIGDAKSAGMWGFGLGASMSAAGDGLQAYLANRAGRKAEDAMVAATPSTEDLLKRGGEMIEAAERGGKTASPEQTADLAKGFLATLQKEGYITPTGKVVADSAPEIRRSLALADEYFLQSMTPEQMSTFRRPLQGAAGSQVPQEARVGTKLLKQFDEWSDPLRPGHAEGRAVYAKGKRGEMMDDAAELARIRAGQFSGSGYENALRTEYRALARKIAKGEIKGLSPDQVAAINKVAEGGPVENAARGLGKAAPTNIVSAGMGGGMPFLIGNALGGPAVGSAAGIGTMAAGALGRRAATKMQSRNAEIASALMRGGKVAPRTPEQILAEQNKRAIIEQLLRYGGAPVVSQ